MDEDGRYVEFSRKGGKYQVGQYFHNGHLVPGLRGERLVTEDTFSDFIGSVCDVASRNPRVFETTRGIALGDSSSGLSDSERNALRGIINIIQSGNAATSPATS